MKTKKIEMYFRMIRGIRYNNENGGAYAYVQFLAYSRELVNLLQPLRGMQRHIESIEAINWLFNEFLAVPFTHRHKSLFDEKMMDMQALSDEIRNSVYNMSKVRTRPVRHAQAA
jgi:hypothetical protein